MRREEWQEQKKLARLLDKWLDGTRAWWTANDPVAPNAISGAIRKQRGVKPGVPDVEVLYRGKLIGIELKSRSGRCTPAQRAEREAILRAGGQWWVCRSANAAMWALYKSGVRFRTIVHEDGTIECWRSPRLPKWEVPRRDPSEPRPQHPKVSAQRRAARRRWMLARRRACAAQLVAGPPYEGAQMSDGPSPVARETAS
jgi:hypothetical protein